MKPVERFPVDEKKYDRYVSVVRAYSRWLRFRVSELENVPRSGPALLVGNHAGLRMHDVFATEVAIRRTHPAHRVVRGLAHREIVGRPWVAALQLEHMALVIGTPEDARGLLEDGWLVLTYPEGARATARPFSERDTLLPIEAWGKGWARLALETEAPVVPVGVSGVEAAIPTFWQSKRLGRAFGLKDDLYPVAPQSPLIGFQPFLTPLVPLPMRCGLAFGRPVVPGERPDDVDGLSKLVYDRVRAAIKQAKRRNGEPI